MPEKNAVLVNCEFYHALLDNLFEALYIVDSDETILYWNKACELLTGYAAEEMVGRSYEQTAIAYVSGQITDEAKQRQGLGRVLESSVAGKWKGSIQRKNGQTIYVKSHITPIQLNDGTVAGAVEILRNMTSQLALEEAHQEILEASRRDSLTGLYNRCSLTEFFKAEIERSKRYQQPFSIILADIDYFKRFNDQYGHEVGDQVLKRISEFFGESIRQPDLVGRWGGEEFLILTPNSDRPGAVHLARRLRKKIGQMSLDDMDETITVSFGVSEFNQGQSLDQLLYQADMALYRAKNNGRDQVAFS